MPFAFVGIALVLSAAPATQDYRFVKGRTEALLPADHESLAWRWTMRMTGWARSHAASGFEFNTPEQVERQVKALKAQGYDTINEGALFWSLAFTHRWDEAIEMARMICHYAHKHGMKVIHHMDGPVITYMGTGLQYLMAHPDWMQRDIRYGLPTFSHACLNNPGFRQEIFGRLVRFARETGVDGFMIDECSFAARAYCGCPYCRRKFTEDTGCVLPTDPDSPVFYNDAHRLWVRWIRWRLRAIGDWWVAVRKALNRVNPRLCLMTYTTHYGLTGRWAPYEFGADVIEKARACDFVGTEIMSRNVFDCYRAVFAYRKVKAAIGDHFGCATLGLVYHQDDPNIAYFGWAVNQMNRQGTWMFVIEGDDMRRYTDWPLQVKKVAARSVADAAILFSTHSRDFGKRYKCFPAALGTSEVLTDAHIQHDFLLDGDVTRHRLSRYKLLVLPCVGCMSAEQVRVVRDYVRGGGALVASGNTALQDEEGFFQDNFQLADVMGVDVDVARATFKGTHDIRVRDDRKAVPCPLPAFRVMPRKDARLTVLADVVEGGKVVGPAITLNRYGKGTCIYLASRLGLANVEEESTAGRAWEFEKDQPLADLLLRVVRMAVEDGFDVKAVSMPERVLTSVHRQNDGDGEKVLVHLLNATGAAKLRKGDIIPDSKPKNAFPALKSDLVLDLRLGDLASGVIVSPDTKGRRPVTLTKSDGGYTRVTVKKGDLKAYAVVYLSLK